MAVALWFNTLKPRREKLIKLELIFISTPHILCAESKIFYKTESNDLPTDTTM